MINDASSSPLTITKAFILRQAWLTVSGRGWTLAYIGTTYTTLHRLGSARESAPDLPASAYDGGSHS